MKKPFLQRKWVWVVGILLIAIGTFEIRTQMNHARIEKERAEATENANKVLKGKVEVPDPYFKSKDEVEKLFEQAGLKADFVVTNFDEKATLNKKDIKVGDCDQLNSDQPNITYYDPDTVGDKSGLYAKKGATIIVGYTDHDFNGKEKGDSSTEQSSDIFAGKVEIPETQFKSKDQVEKDFEAVGLKANFVVENLDDMATQNKVKIKVGDCGVIADQPGMGFLDNGEKYGIYADEGATLTIGYSDHDFDGTGENQTETVESTSSETVESSSTEDDGDITKLSSKPTSKQQTTLRVLGKQAFEQQYPYKGSKMHSIMGIIQDWTQKGDVWFFKCEATIVNEYGAELETVVEITIEPTGPESGNVTVLHY